MHAYPRGENRSRCKTRFHLEYLHLQILSVVSAEQLRRMFERRGNFDLRRLLSGAEPFMHSLLSRLEFDLALSTSSLNCLRLDPKLRKSVADVLVPTSKIKDVLYMVLIAQGRVITLVRPKKHSIHPSDLHILINTIHVPSIMNSSASASWLPICLPKFDPAAFVNAYVTFMRPRSDSSEPVASPIPSPSVFGSVHGDAEEPVPRDQDSNAGQDTAPASSTAQSILTAPETAPVDVGLVCVSGQADFEAVRSWCTSVTERLENDGLLKAMTDAIQNGKTTYLVSDLSIPGLRHFVYKSRPHVQVTMPEYEDPYDDQNEKRRLITLYQILHDNIHAKSGQESTLKLQYIRTERESVMGWITQPFELYLALSPLIPKSAAINAANAIARIDMASILGLRLANFAPRQCRTLVNRAASRPVPQPRSSVDTPAAFLSAIGRKSETKLPTVPESWEELWKLDGQALKKAGLTVKDRKYIMWSMQKYREGADPAEFAHPPQARRKIRGRGPAVQNGKRIRSRRL
ncbi:hypothetical protein EUX98_g3458 [Antrodiella citrinella]|uniref:Vacuolar fusion protein MON1 n=1 Tax=Antrodiella citrinella TaxID=2447956 RepID=A0A4V3XIW3_9APHY|nr:hypothetical protein EUX98_g3458 [Antrodiella citrinella]